MLKNCPNHARDVQTILDCFSGADGGVSFVELCRFLADLEGVGYKKKVASIENLARLIRTLYPNIDVENPYPQVILEDADNSGEQQNAGEHENE